jgi:hypothetical protein
LPPHRNKSIPVIVDSYGAMLLAATRGGERYPDATAAFKSPDAQRDVRALLAACRFVVLGWRGEWQLNEETKAWVHAHFVRRHGLIAGGLGLDVWERAY